MDANSVIIAAATIISIMIFVWASVKYLDGDKREQRKADTRVKKRAKLKERFEEAERLAKQHNIYDDGTTESEEFRENLALCKGIERDGYREVTGLQRKVELVEDYVNARI